MRYSQIILFCLLGLLLTFCKEDESPQFRLSKAYVGTREINLSGSPTMDVALNEMLVLSFSVAVDPNSAETGITLEDGENNTLDFTTGFLSNNKTVTLTPSGALDQNTQYTIRISKELKSKDNQSFSPMTFSFVTERGTILLTSILIGDQPANNTNRILDAPRALDIELTFSLPVNTATLEDAVSITGMSANDLNFTFSDENRKVTISSSETLEHLKRHNINISAVLEGAAGERFTTYSRFFYTEVDPTPKMPLLPNDEDNDNDNTNDLLSAVQKQTFNYFWDYADFTSGMARERNGADYVTSGGSGFGIMALIVGMERNFITRPEGLTRMNKILTFLEGADRFHGAWPHWMKSNGDVLPFSANDNGGDLVETAFLVQGLLTFRQYLESSVPAEQALINRINALWQGVEWDWYRRSGQNVMYWHWSPDKDWAMNLQVRGWNEALMMYVLGASSPTHAIPKVVYTEGWARNGAMQNGTSYEGITLPLGIPYGGPLFFTHYSFVGMNPHNLIDPYANYWTQNVNHSLINYKYCVRNPKKFAGYSEDSWGLTASDNHISYSAHSPTNDLGVISPTAALSSFPYTPTESMRALKFFYYTMGDRLWGEYGFYDAFNVTEDWYASSYLAIDQGPIVVMIENYRTGLLWDLFMSAPEVQTGLTNLGFTSFETP